MFSFSSKTPLALVICACLFLSIQSICLAQDSQDPTTDIDDNNLVNDQINFNMPIAPRIQDEFVQEKPIIPDHPPLLERSHAALMPLSVMSLPAPAQKTQPKTPLAWRARSQKLGSERFNEDTAVQQGPLCRSVDGYFLSTMQSIITACNKEGYRVTHANKAAGEILASNVNDPNYKIIFVIWEKPAGKTWVKAGIERGSGQTINTQLVSILDTVCGTSTKGKL